MVKLFKKVALDGGDCRLTYFIDSHVAKSALCRGRSASSSLQPLLKRACSWCLSFGLYQLAGLLPLVLIQQITQQGTRKFQMPLHRRFGGLWIYAFFLPSHVFESFAGGVQTGLVLSCLCLMPPLFFRILSSTENIPNSPLICMNGLWTLMQLWDILERVLPQALDFFLQLPLSLGLFLSTSISSGFLLQCSLISGWARSGCRGVGAVPFGASHGDAVRITNRAGIVLGDGRRVRRAHLQIVPTCFLVSSLVGRKGTSFETVVMEKNCDLDKLNQWLVEYGRWLFASGKPYYYFLKRSML